MNPTLVVLTGLSTDGETEADSKMRRLANKLERELLEQLGLLLALLLVVVSVSPVALAAVSSAVLLFLSLASPSLAPL